MSNKIQKNSNSRFIHCKQCGASYLDLDNFGTCPVCTGKAKDASTYARNVDDQIEYKNARKSV